ncbi:MAG: hypothetical protein OXI92_03265 [Acidobacteriota bacterium]|nr:hypothetical protein [Acidobacteriota bacterium]
MRAWRELATALSLTGVGVAVFAPGVEATTVKQFSLEQMVRGSHRIMLGRRVSEETYWNKSRTRIYTATRFAVTEDLKGEFRETATVVTVGGTVDGMTLAVSGTPSFGDHEEVLLFLEAGKGGNWILMGLSQGMFRITVDRRGVKTAHHASSGLHLIPGSPESSSQTPIPNRAALDQLLSRIRQLVGNSGK